MRSKILINTNKLGFLDKRVGFSRFNYRNIPIQISGLLFTLTIAAAVPTISNSIAPAFAQTSNNTKDFPLPDSALPKSLSDDKTITIYGASSMRTPNEALKKRLQAKYPDAQVQLATTTTTDALRALQAGKIELAAVGRPLTQKEKDQQLVFVPIKREKIAIIIGPNNPFRGNLTFEQFAKIFRGEITDWSQVGGPKGKIRFVDRPAYSDTRLALSKYDVFKKAPFKTGSTATPVSNDNTAIVIASLGRDGISYAIADQVINSKNVRIVPMHKVLPTDPRYPYSQVRGYVYKEGAAFAIVPPPEAATPEGVAPATPEGVAPATPEGVAPTTPTDNPTDNPITEQEGAFPWWLLLLLLIPLLGGLLWWLLKGSKGKSKDQQVVPPVTPAPAPTPTPVPVPPVIPVPPIQSESGELIVDAAWGNDANEMQNLPSYTNKSDKAITLKIDTEGTWSYGAPDPNHQFDLQVDADGNQNMAEKEWQDSDLRFPNVKPAELVALKNGEVIRSGKGPYEITLQPNETISFVINDQPGFYKDNNGKIAVKWSVINNN